MSPVLGAYCFYSVWSIFRVLNMNHRLNDLLPRAVTAKAFVSIPHPASWQRFTPEHTRATLQLLMSCVTAPTGSGQVGRRRADSDHYA